MQNLFLEPLVIQDRYWKAVSIPGYIHDDEGNPSSHRSHLVELKHFTHCCTFKNLLSCILQYFIIFSPSLLCKFIERNSCYFLSLFSSTNRYFFPVSNIFKMLVFVLCLLAFSFFNICPNKEADSINDTCNLIFAFTSCRTYSYSRHTY